MKRLLVVMLLLFSALSTAQEVRFDRVEIQGFWTFQSETGLTMNSVVIKHNGGNLPIIIGSKQRYERLKDRYQKGDYIQVDGNLDFTFYRDEYFNREFINHMWVICKAKIKSAL